MKSTIAIDLDNVIAKTDTKIREIIKSLSGISLVQDDIQRWDYSEVLMCKGLDAQQAEEIMGLTMGQFHEHDCFEVEPLTRAVDIIFEIHHAGLEVMIVTGRKKTRKCEELTKRWLREQLIPDSWLLMEENKSSICTQWSFLIEDAPHHAQDVANAGIPVLLFDYPWNRSISHRLVKRISGWDEVRSLVLRKSA